MQIFKFILKLKVFFYYHYFEFKILGHFFESQNQTFSMFSDSNLKT
jgi:hypothetical protein